MSLRPGLKCQFPPLSAANRQSLHLRLTVRHWTRLSSIHKTSKLSHSNRRKGHASAPVSGCGAQGGGKRAFPPRPASTQLAPAAVCLDRTPRDRVHPSPPVPPNLICAVDHVCAARKLGKGGLQLYFPPLPVILPELLTACFHLLNFLCTHHRFSTKPPCRPFKLSSMISPMTSLMGFFLVVSQGLQDLSSQSGVEPGIQGSNRSRPFPGLIPGSEDPLEEETATHSSILAWEIPRTKEPDGLQSMGSQSRMRLSTHTCSGPNPWHPRDSLVRSVSFWAVFPGAPGTLRSGLFLSGPSSLEPLTSFC